MTFQAAMDRDFISEAETEQQRNLSDESQARFLREALSRINPAYKSQAFYARLIEDIRKDACVHGCFHQSVMANVSSALADCVDCVIHAGSDL